MTTPAHGYQRPVRSTSDAPPSDQPPASTPPLFAVRRDSALSPPRVPVFAPAAAALEESGTRARLGAVKPPPPPPTDEDPVDLRWEMIQRYEEGDLRGALDVAERLLAIEPGSENARQTAKRCRHELSTAHLATLGGPHATPRLVLDGATLKMLALDHRAGFVLSLVDGVSTIDEILDVSAMAKHEALGVMASLLRRGVIAVGS